MVLFHNPKAHPLTFDLAGQKYEVPAGGEVEVPADVAYGVASRGLPLVEGRAPVAPPPPPLIVEEQVEDATVKAPRRARPVKVKPSVEDATVKAPKEE